MQFGRTPIIAVIATCTAAVAATGGLALARGDDPPVARPAQAGTPPAAYGVSGGPRARVKAAKWRRLLTLRVPGGDYLVLGSATLASELSTGSDCRMRGRGGPTLDTASQDLAAAAPGGGTRSTVSLQFTGATGRVIDLECRAGRVWFSSASKLTAVAVTFTSAE